MDQREEYITPFNAEKKIVQNIETKGLCQFEIIINVLLSSFRLCYGFTTIIYFYSFNAGIVFGRQNMTSKVDPRTERVNNSSGVKHWLSKLKYFTKFGTPL